MKSKPVTTPRDILAALEIITAPARAKVRSRHSFSHVASFARVCAGREGELATADELAELREAHTRSQEFQRQIEEVSHDSARQTVKGNRESYKAAPARESFEKLRASAVTKPELTERHRTIRAAVKDAMREHTRKTAGLAVPVLIRARSMVEAASDELRAIEQAAADRYGVTFAPSATLGGLTSLIFRIEEQTIIAHTGTGVRVSVAGFLSGILTF